MHGQRSRAAETQDEPCVLQGAAVSGERISQGPPGNVVFLGCPPPPRRVSERSVQMLPLGLPFQDVVLTVKLHINPETSLERLVPLVEFRQCGNFCQISFCIVLQTIEKGYQYSSGLARPSLWGCFPRGGPPAGSGNGTRGQSSVRERGHRICTSLQQGNRALQPVFQRSKEGWGVASHFRSSSSERLHHAAQVQNVNFEINRATDQIRGLVCQDRSQGRILPRIHPSVSQEVSEVRFWGQSIPI